MLSPNTAAQASTRKLEPIESFYRSLKKLQRGDLFTLSRLVQKESELIPGVREIFLKLRYDQTFGQRSAITVLPTREVRCNMVIPSIPVELQSLRQGEVYQVLITAKLYGTPVHSIENDLSARQQLKQMQSILETELNASIHGEAFGDEKALQQTVLDVIQGSKQALAKHLLVTNTLVEVSVRSSSQSSAADSAQNADSINTIRRENPIDQTGNPQMEMLSSINAGNKQSTAIKQLMEELDFNLMSAASPSSALKDLIEELDLQLASAFSASGNLTSMETHHKDSDAPVQAQRPMERGVVIALGSNVGNKIEEIEKACRAIDEDPDMRIVDTSFLYETKPMYVEDQESFMNGACEVSDAVADECTVT